MAITLSPDQQNAADSFMEFLQAPDEKAMVIMGPAGCGKSTLTQHLLDMVRAEAEMLKLVLGTPNAGKNIYCTATTNKAAQVTAAITGQAPKTIYSLLNMRVQNDYSTGKTKLVKAKDFRVYRESLIFIDEVSFAGHELLQAMKEGTFRCKLILIGDQYQLAPVGVSKPPAFDLDIRKAPLTTINRNAGPIAIEAAKFRDAVITGKFEQIQTNGKEIIHVDGPGFQKAINEQFAQSHLMDSTHDNDAKILAWTNQRVRDYNNYVRELQGLPPEIIVGERVMSNSMLMQGPEIVATTDEIVTITKVEEEREYYGIKGRMLEFNHMARAFMPYNWHEANHVMKNFARAKSWPDYFAIKERWADFRAIHACTVHKSQGSTYRRTFIDLHDIGRCNKAEDVARMLYVALSRASEQVILYGSLPAKFGGTPA